MLQCMRKIIMYCKITIVKENEKLNINLVFKGNKLSIDIIYVQINDIERKSEEVKKVLLEEKEGK